MKLTILGAAAALAIAMPLATATPSAAQSVYRDGGAPAVGGSVYGGGMGGGGAAIGGGGRPGGGAAIGGGRPGGGSGWQGGGGRPGGGAGWQGGGPRPGGGWHGGGRPGGWHGGHVHRRGGGGFYPGLAAGAIIGGALAAPFAFGYSDPYYYDDDYVEAPAVTSDADAIAYCKQRFRSYDVRTGTYLGYDGLRHPCP